ncbi:hypothetical protein GFS24_19575 [Chitinophaga sp. SYP-B3965]|uniref:hypothetical protein n=1 Tax=Chitinophaga sp. SYP-B3965 TaxID=2663120 RepID=UPI001299775F|nr:hypothetical protein [Chitinophaga sp. SYP-B3965]MRG47330.1 hypothetical protein [Chitinophaga sp. SYP-B3965]
MKTISIVLFAMFSSIGAFAQAEEQAIKKVLAEETTSFFKHDFKTSYSKWHVVPQSVGIVSHLNGETLYLTDKELDVAYTTKELSKTVFPDTFDRSRWKFRINATSAYVTFDQNSLKGKKIIGQTHESRYMEKISGEWKIVSMNVVNYKK